MKCSCEPDELFCGPLFIKSIGHRFCIKLLGNVSDLCPSFFAAAPEMTEAFSRKVSVSPNSELPLLFY